MDTNYTLKVRSETALAFILLALVLAYNSTFGMLYQRWIKFDEGLSHGLPVCFLFLYLLWIYRPFPKTAYSDDHKTLSLAFLFFSSLLWFISTQIHINIVSQLLILPILLLAISSALGFKTAVHLSGPITFLVFAIPLWDHINDSLLVMSSVVVGYLVESINIPALIEGNSITIPSGRILIADGCSGLRYFVVSIAMSSFLCCINSYGWKRNFLVLVVAALLGLIVNWLRIIIIVLIGYFTEMQSSLMEDHELFGWALFAIICLPFVYMAPVTKKIKVKNPLVMINAGHLLLPLLCVFSGPILFYFAPQSAAKPSLNTVNNYIDCDLQQGFSGPISIAAPETDRIIFGRLECRKNLYIHVAQYARLSPSEKLVPYFNRLYNNELWFLESETIERIGGYQVKVGYFRQIGSNKLVVRLFWLDVGGFITADYWKAKLLQLPATYLGENRFSIVTFQSLCKRDNCEEAYEAIKLTAENWFSIEKVI